MKPRLPVRLKAVVGFSGRLMLQFFGGCAGILVCCHGLGMPDVSDGDVEPMLIANPMYDSIFKYFMEDSRVARLLLGAVIGKTILELEPRPQEIVITRDNPAKHSVFRLDFSAKIKTAQGFRLVIVEVQKAKHSTDILRFRRYLGKQYGDPRNIEKREETGKDRRGVPIISIYFLGYSLDGIDAPVVKVGRSYTDLTTKKILNVKNDFIESLTHDSYIIQTTMLKARRRTELESVLAVFDPDNIHDSEHLLNVDETQFPDKYRDILRRLRKAAESDEMREVMYAEDDLLEELAEAERAVEAKQQALQERDRVLKQLAEKDNELAVKDSELAERKNLIERTVLNLFRFGQSAGEICEITGLSLEAVTAMTTSRNRVCCPAEPYGGRNPDPSPVKPKGTSAKKATAKKRSM